MSPNLVFQQVISHHKSRLSPSMSISTLEASTADSQPMGNGCQWYIYIYTFFHTLKWIRMYNQYLIPTIYTLAAAKQVGLNCFPPNSTPECNCLPPFQPYQPLQSEESEDSLVPSVSHLWYRRLESGVGAESTKGKWAEQLGHRWEKKANAQPVLEAGGEGFCGWDTILFFFPCINRFVIAFLRM